MNESNIPPDGKFAEYKEPHSPFQKLIDTARRRYGLSGRDLAERLGVSQSTLWLWLHNLNGFPHPKSFNSEHVRRLGEVLQISESEIKAALDASRHDRSDSFGKFIHVLEKERRKTLSTSYVLNLAKNLHRRPKVTLLVLAGMLFAAISHADDLQTLVTISGKRFENANVTEVTPTTITIKHASGVARVPFTELCPELQKKYGYDAAKAHAWIAEQWRQQWAGDDAARKKRLLDREAFDKNMDQIRLMTNAVYDPASRRWYRSMDEAMAARQEALRAVKEAQFMSGKP